MKTLRRLILAALLLLAAALSAAAGSQRLPKGWDSVDPPASAQQIEPDETEILTLNGYVYVIARREVKVAILTVLGQPVTEVTLPAGCHRFRIASRGIYILRADTSTFRITI